MSLRAPLAALALLALSVSAAHGQDTPPPTLQEAHQALADALARHDRAAFVDVFAADARCTLPAPAQGPDAIAALWLPFLIDPGTTMLLTATEVVTAGEGDHGTTSGTFSIRGRTANGIRTVPGGVYSIDWRMIDGRWKISTLEGSGHGTPRESSDRGGVGPYRFGMSRDDVRRVAACQPYTPVAVTGGLECPNYTFDGRTMNVSFLFTADRLSRIQLWYYEGTSGLEARDAVGRVVTYLERTTGKALLCSQRDVPVTADGVIAALDRAPRSARQIVQVEIQAAASPTGERWFSRVGRHEYGYGVMLFADPRPGP